MKKLLLLLILLAGSRLSAQTNNARMLSGTNTVTVCPYTIQASDQTKLLVFNTSGCAVTLPAASTFGPGVEFSVKNDGSGSVTITPSSGTISGAGSLVLTTSQGADIYTNSTATGYEVQQGAGANGCGGGIINDVCTVTSATTSAPLPQGIPLGNSGSAVSSCPYTVLADSATTTKDRGTALEFNSASACSVTLPDPATSGMGSSFALRMSNIGAGIVTVNRQTAAVFNVSTGGGAPTIGAISFTIAQGGFCTLHSDNGTNWYVEQIAGNVALGISGQPA